MSTKRANEHRMLQNLASVARDAHVLFKLHANVIEEEPATVCLLHAARLACALRPIQPLIAPQDGAESHEPKGATPPAGADEHDLDSARRKPKSPGARARIM